jgi:hypothetical protein
MKRSLSFALLICLASPSHADGFGPSTSIFPPYSTSIFPAPSLQGSVAVLGPRWPSVTKSKTTSPKMSIERGVLEAGEFSTSAPFGSALNALKDAALKDASEYGKASKDAAAAGSEMMATLKGRLTNKAGAVEGGRRMVAAEVSALEQQAEHAAKQGSFLSKLGNALQILDFVSVAAQGAGYLYEGDATGAVGVVANEVAKKTSEGVGALVTSFVPGGPVFGSWAGNKAWQKYLKPVIDEREQNLREAELARQISNKPWLTPKSFMDSTGQVRDLEADQYIERGTGLVQRRPPEEQAGFEQAEHTKWMNQKTMAQVQQDYTDGKIDDAKLVELQISYQGRSLVDPWQPLGYSTPWADAWDNEDEDEDASATEMPSEDSTGDVLAAVAPIALTATGSFTESFIEVNDSHVTLEFGFWNLGAFSPGYEKAVLKITSSYDESFSLVGRFSGGPNGTLTFTDDEGLTQSFRVQGGTQLVGEIERLIENGTALEMITLAMPLSVSDAFVGWPDD